MEWGGVGWVVGGEGDAWLGWWVGGNGAGPAGGVGQGREKKGRGVSETCAGAEKTWIGGLNKQVLGVGKRDFGGSEESD